MSNDEIYDLLTQIKGVGKWTVEMILMFTLGREDIFAMDDLGLKQSVIRLYKIKETDKKLLREKIEKISLKWSPTAPMAASICGAGKMKTNYFFLTNGLFQPFTKIIQPRYKIREVSTIKNWVSVLQP